MENSKLFRNPDKLRNSSTMQSVKDVKRVAVFGAGRGAGVSFLSGGLAAAAKLWAPREDVSLIEMGSAYFYEAYGIEKRFVQREFISFYDRLFYKKSLKGLSNIEERINWILRCPFDRQPENESIADRLRLVHNVAGSLLIFDCSAVCEELLWNILPEMDAVVAVLDPLPSRLIPSGAFLQRMRFSRPDSIFVANKMNPGVHRGELKRFMRGTDLIFLPLAPVHGLYRAEYNCVLPFAVPEVRPVVEKPLREILSAVLGSAR